MRRPSWVLEHVDPLRQLVPRRAAAVRPLPRHADDAVALGRRVADDLRDRVGRDPDRTELGLLREVALLHLRDFRRCAEPGSCGGARLVFQKHKLRLRRGETGWLRGPGGLVFQKHKVLSGGASRPAGRAAALLDGLLDLAGLEALRADVGALGDAVQVPGNHDEFLRDFYGTHFGGVEVAEHAIHEGADGRRYLVIHGDYFDLVVTQARWLALLGNKAYDFAIAANRVLNTLRRRLGFPYWSLSQWAKLKVKNAVNYIGEFERTLVEEAQRHRADGVICGHIHHAVVHDDFGIRYINCGDWVESCTAVGEHPDGRFEIIVWTDRMRAPVPALTVESPPEQVTESELAA